MRSSQQAQLSTSNRAGVPKRVAGPCGAPNCVGACTALGSRRSVARGNQCWPQVSSGCCASDIQGRCRRLRRYGASNPDRLLPIILRPGSPSASRLFSEYEILLPGKRQAGDSACIAGKWTTELYSLALTFSVTTGASAYTLLHYPR
ncbi:hypothetical protein MRX96_044172 [Rhipicephalus microplus]